MKVNWLTDLYWRLTYCRREGHKFPAYGGDSLVDDTCGNCGYERNRDEER